MKRAKKVVLFLLIPLIASILGCVLLLGAAAIPQSYIQDDASQSVVELMKCGQYQSVFNPGYASYQMDNFTDALILMSAYNLKNPTSVLTNPKHHNDDETINMITSLDEVVNQGVENEALYVRYWQGFRLFVRPLLAVFSFFEIRRIVAFVFFLLFAVVIAMLYNKTNLSTTLCMVVSILLVNPAVVSHSLQFSACFILTFIFVILILSRPDFTRKHLMSVFCFMGVLTMFFDFYTTPILTFGISILVLLAVLPEEENSWIISGKALLAWIYGYAMMWLAKLTLTTLLTDVNGFKDGFMSFAGRTGIVQVVGKESCYNAENALVSVWKTVFPNRASSWALWGMIILLLASLIFLFFADRKGFVKKLVYLPIAVLPVIWFSVAAQPTVIHAWFQYRSIAVLFAAIFLFISSAFCIAFRKIYGRIHP